MTNTTEVLDTRLTSKASLATRDTLLDELLQLTDSMAIVLPKLKEALK
jgi:hypothetical protein